MSVVEELTGETPDADCLHCQVAPLVGAAMPNKDSGKVIAELLQVIAEVIASTTDLQRIQDRVDEAAVYLSRRAHEDFETFRRMGKLS